MHSNLKRLQGVFKNAPGITWDLPVIMRNRRTGVPFTPRYPAPVLNRVIWKHTDQLEPSNRYSHLDFLHHKFSCFLFFPHFFCARTIICFHNCLLLEKRQHLIPLKTHCSGVLTFKKHLRKILSQSCCRSGNPGNQQRKEFLENLTKWGKIMPSFKGF